MDAGSHISTLQCLHNIVEKYVTLECIAPNWRSIFLVEYICLAELEAEPKASET